ncbi:MAG: TolC family outer membrane protein [Pseudomonadales bacterium]|nr:TolC family outer membrane protein [Pseudomonadales bacterium]
MIKKQVIVVIKRQALRQRSKQKAHIAVLISALMMLTSAATSAMDMGNQIDLKQAYNLADKNDPQWSSIKHNYEAQKENYYQARSQLLPNITLSAEATEQRTKNDGEDSESSQRQVYSATIQQPLFRLDSWYAFKQVKATDKQVDVEFESAKHSFIIGVLDAYLNVLRANENLAFRKAEESAIARQKDQTEQRYEVGLIAKTDVHEAQAAFDIAAVLRIVAERDLSLALKSLETLTGTVISSVKSLADDFPINPPQPSDINEWLDMAKQNNKSLKSARLTENAAENEFKARRAQHYPIVNLVGNYSINETNAVSNFGGSEFETPDSETTSLAIKVELPLYTGGLTTSNRRQAKSLLYKAQDDARFTERDVLKNTSNLVRVVDTRVAEVRAQQLSIRSGQSALEATQAGYEAGTRTIVDVLNAQRVLYQAKRDYADARFNYILDSLRLKQIAGILTDKDLLSLNQWLR